MADPLPLDYHIHTAFSCDCEIPMADMCRAAVSRGIPEIGFAEHFDLLPEDPSYGFFRFDDWWEELERCRRSFRGSLVIRAGIEIGEPHRFPEIVAPMLARFPWDYSLGSLHWVDGTLIWDRAYYQRSEEQAYRDYFLELQRLAAAGGFDVLAHMDVVKHYGSQVYGPFDPGRYEPEIRAVLAACVHNGIAIEINTGLLRRPVAQVAPEQQILSWYRQAGGKYVTAGSDAHLPEHVGFGLELAVAAARAAGFPNLTRFIARRPSPLQHLAHQEPT
ncbi:MAG: hypothetical protein A2Y93_16310 [Chloroflexi bacterium RBG_13_68_17]|nr:MAG: hypothetical protein A2Y93_16310 [Chloroflexi bacterium RBG_13_68_17]